MEVPWFDERGVPKGEGGRAKALLQRTVVVDLDCEYTRKAVLDAFRRDSWRSEVGVSWRVADLSAGGGEEREIGRGVSKPDLYWGEYERIDWESVGFGEVVANCYCIRKGLIRKAQLALATAKWKSKHPDSVLARSVPETHVFELYDIEYFDEVLIADVPELREMKPEDVWILKPNITNQGLGVRVFNDLGTLRDILSSEEAWNLREWVVQRYVRHPLVVDSRKFHVRVYVLCVGALEVYVYEDMLALFAPEAYDLGDLGNLGAHLTNTCAAGRLGGVDLEQKEEESRIVKMVEEVGSEAEVGEAKAKIREVVAECLAAVSAEVTSFMPMPNCFELFGFDFLIDREWGVWLLEANAEPDFVQTGHRLRNALIGKMMGDAAEIVTAAALPLPAPRGRRGRRGKWSKVFEKKVAGTGGGVGFQVT